MSSNLYNKALRNIKLKDNAHKVSCTENEINENLKKSFEFELKNLIKAVELKKLIPTKLYEFLIKYENNLPTGYFYRHVMELGDLLLKNSYPEIAKYQCYQRYLVKIHKLDISFFEPSVEENFQSCLNLDCEEELELAVSAILGSCLAQFRCVEIVDPRIASGLHQQICGKLLHVCQQVAEVVVKREKYCWLVFNATVSIYLIGQRLIRCGSAMIAVEPLTWAACCLETSIPLLNISNLKWRATIYSAVCEALFNVECDMEAEVFARRGLLKILELNELYEMSSDTHCVENALAISESVIKMGVMIFKRNVFETRRRPKTFLRPKTKVNFKEVLQTSWPRTGTERILAEMFEGPSQQILAVLEAAKQSSRSIGKIEAPALENDWEILDVYSELFYAAIAIISGRSTSSGKPEKGAVIEYKLTDIEPDCDQLTLAVRNGKGVSIDTAFELVCWAFSYGNWEFLDCLIEPLVNAVKDSKNVRNKAAIENTLTLLALMRKAVHSSSFVEKKSTKINDQAPEDEKAKLSDTRTGTRNTQRSVSTVSKDTKSSKSKKENSTDGLDEKTKTDSKHAKDPLSQLAAFVEFILDHDFDMNQYFQEILIEAGSILWTKCKSVFQSTQDGSLTNQSKKPFSKLGKWLRVLNAAHRILSVVNFADTNPVSYSEMSIRLALLLEQLAVNGGFMPEETTDDISIDEYNLDAFIASLNSDRISKSERCITAAKDILRTSINKMGRSRNLQSMNKENQKKPGENSSITKNSSDDIFLDMNSVYLRICGREISIYMYLVANENCNLAQIRKSQYYKDVLIFCNKNLLLLAIFQAHLGNLMKENLHSSEVLELVHHIKALLQKSGSNLSNVKSISKVKEPSDINDKLPSPIVESKGSSYIEVRLDSNISPTLKSKIGWVRLYARAVDTPNAEVRLTDDKLPGTGMESSSLTDKFTISQLTPNEQYILAFSAYDKFGSPIGRGIGQSTKKILATDSINPISVISIIAQAFFEIGLKEDVILYENVLWNNFVEPIAECKDLYQKSQFSRSNLHCVYKIKTDLLNCSSSMLLRQFCLLVLSSVDCECRLRNMSYDICDRSSTQIQDQMHRLRLSDKLLALFIVSKKLKDHLLTMEIFTSICGLMVPIMNHNQFHQSFMEVLITCINTLHSLPQTTWIKISITQKTQIHHLLACTGFYLLKCINKIQPENEIGESIKNSVTILLQMSGNSPFKVSDQEDIIAPSGNSSRVAESGDKVQVAEKKKVASRSNKNDGFTFTTSPQQVAFESYKTSMYKQSLTDHQLTGNEEPDILLAYIAYLPSRIAYKEVSKFSRKTRYFQFIVEILNKSVIEGNIEQSFNYYKDIREWLRKRNESIIGRSIQVIPSQPNTAKASNTVPVTDVLARSEEDFEDSKRPPKPKKKTKYKAINVHPNMSETQKQIQEQAELKALEVLSSTFCSMYKQNQKRRKFRQVSDYERPSRVKMNMAVAMAYLSTAHAKIDSLTQSLNAGYRFSELPEMEDITKFMLDGTGKILPLEEIPNKDETAMVLKTTKQQGPRISDTARTFRSDNNNTDKRLLLEIPKLLSQFSDSLSKIVFLLKRAVVLSHRGRNWILLSKACALSWFSLSNFINTSCKLNKFIDLAKKESLDIDWSQIQPISLKGVFKTFSMLFYLSSDCLMDMIQAQDPVTVNKSSKHFDSKFMENFVLRSLHMLHECKNYEKSIHLILRFTKLTKFIFVNSTHPILIHCQTELCRTAKRNQEKNPDWTEDMCYQHIKQAMSLLNCASIDSENYEEFLVKRQKGTFGRVKVGQEKSKFFQRMEKFENEEKHIQNLLSILKSENGSIFLFSVPVDAASSENEWDKHKNEINPRKSWIELCYRKNYYNFGRNQNNFHGDTPKMSFKELLNSYKEQMDESISQNDMEHYSLILRDMGDLYNENLHQPRLSLPLWNESLDCIFSEKDSIKSMSIILGWENTDGMKYISQTENLVSKYGISNCLIAGGLLSRISRFESMTSDERITLCLQAATFYKSVFSTSLTHPEQDLNYLDYSLYLDSINQIPLVAKLNIFSDNSVVDIQDIEYQLDYLLTKLIQSGYYQFSISLLALYEYIVYTMVRNPVKCIQVQIMKLEISIKLRQFSNASRIIFQLLTGDKLPQLTDSRTAPTISRTPSNVYDDRKQINDEQNIKTLDKILSRRLNPSLAQRFGSHLSNKISLLQAEFLLELASSIPVAPEVINPKSFSSPNNSLSQKRQTTKKSELLGIQTEEESCSVVEKMSSNLQLQSWEDISLSVLKGLMLQISSEIVQPIIEDFISSIQREDFGFLKMTLSEVDSVLSGLVVQSRNCRLRQCNRSGARLAMFACNLLRDYFTESVQCDIKSARISGKFNILFHMKCNQEMVECLLDEISIGNMMEPSQTAVPDVPSTKDLIMSSISECDEHGLAQHKARFIAALAQYALISGYEVEKYKDILKESVNILENENFLSDEGELVLVDSRMKLMNVDLSTDKTLSLTIIENVKVELGDLHERLLKIIDNEYCQSVLWNTVDRDLSQITICNVYDKKYLYLCKIKLLLANTTMEICRFVDDKISRRLKVLFLLNVGLDLCRSLSYREPWTEVEFLMLIGRTQRYLMSNGHVSSSSAISTFVEGLKLSTLSTGHLGMRKQFFLELAITFMECSHLSDSSFNAAGEIVSSAKLLFNAQISQLLQQKSLTKVDAMNFRKLAWLSLRCANHVSDCIQNLNVLKSDSSCMMSQEAQDNLPVSALFDLFGRYKLGIRRIIFKNEIEEELSRMPESKIPRDNEHLDDQIDKIKKSLGTVTLSQVLAYHELILKLSNNQFISKCENSGFKMKSLTRYVFSFDLLFEKESQIHSFLMNQIPEYKKKCVTSIPKEILNFSMLNTIEGLGDTFLDHTNQNLWNIKSTKETVNEIQNQIILTVDYPVGIIGKEEVLERLPLEKMDVQETEILFQFYGPPFEFNLHSNTQVLLMYACTKKVAKSISKLEALSTGWILIPSENILQVYRDIQECAHLLEILSSSADSQPGSKSSDNNKKLSTLPNQNTPAGKQPKTNVQQLVLPQGFEMSSIELKVRQVFDQLSAWVGSNQEYRFSPSNDLLIKNSDNSFVISGPGSTINSIPFDLTRENIRVISNALNPILPRPITNASPIVKFLQEMLRIEL